MELTINGVPKIANMSETDKRMFFQSYLLIRAIKEWKVNKEKEPLPNTENLAMTPQTQDVN